MDDFRLFTSLRYDPTLLKVPDQGFSATGWNQEPSSLYMLDLHRDRMLRAAHHWGWTPAIQLLTGSEGLDRLRSYIESLDLSPDTTVPHRIKVELSREGVFSHQKGPVPSRPLSNFFPSRLPAPHGSEDDDYAVDSESSNSSSSKLPTKDLQFEVVADTRNTTQSAFTHFKTTKRDMYDGARERTVIGMTDSREVLLINDANGQIMEGSMTTPYFWRDGQWVTPPVPRQYSEGAPTSSSSSSGSSGGNDGTTRRWALERNLAIEKPVLASELVDGEECWISNGVRGFIFGKIKLKSSD